MKNNSLPRRIVRNLRGRSGLARMNLMRGLSTSRTLETELAPGHPSMDVIAQAKQYNRLRCAENGRPILDANRVLNFSFALDLVARLPAGDYAELGTYRGVTGSLIWRGKAPGATFHCFDTFEGFDDRDLKDDRLDNAGEKAAFANTSIDLVKNRIAGGDHPELKLQVGFFPETFSGLEDHTFRMVHIDMDLADPLTSALEIFWPRMVDGGIILIHDYKSIRYPMAAEAVDAFFHAHGIIVWPLSDRLGTAMVIKQSGMPT